MATSLSRFESGIRLTNFVSLLYTVPMNTKDIGSLSESIVMTALLKQGHRVSVPWGENSPYDLVLDDGKLQRVQVKTGKLENGSVLFRISSTYYDGVAKKPISHRYEKGTVDVFGVYCPQNDKVYIVPDSVIDSGAEVRLRVDPVKCENVRMKWAKDYELGR